MHRPIDWPARLAAFLAERRHVTFDWAANNCALFAADWIVRLTGRDPAADLRGRRWTPWSVAHWLREVGGLAALADVRLGPRVPVVQARRGDVVAVRLRSHPCLGICTGSRVALVSPDGLVLWPLTRGLAAWRID
jgi:hypothetical protein